MASRKESPSPYGTWESSITAKSVASGSHVFELKLHGDDVYFVEVRPLEEKARYSIMKVEDQAAGLQLKSFRLRSTRGQLFTNTVEAGFFSPVIG